LTFREKASDVAWQKQLRDLYASEGAPPVDLSLKRAVVRRVSRTTAERIILKYEWLGTMAKTGHHYGIFFGAYCAGVCCFCVGGGTAGPKTYDKYGVEQKDVATLSRGACVHWAPSGSNSKLVSWSCRLLGRDEGIKIVAAYSDSDAGEIGTIYQACGWSYVGKSQSPDEWVAPSGRVFNQAHPQTLAKQRGGTWKFWAEHLRRHGWHEQKSNPKGRYVLPLDDEVRKRVKKMEQPYPKRAKHSSDAPASQAGEDGAAPIRTLHETTDAVGQ